MDFRSIILEEAREKTVFENGIKTWVLATNDAKARRWPFCDSILYRGNSESSTTFYLEWHVDIRYHLPTSHTSCKRFYRVQISNMRVTIAKWIDWNSKPITHVHIKIDKIDETQRNVYFPTISRESEREVSAPKNPTIWQIENLHTQLNRVSHFKNIYSSILFFKMTFRSACWFLRLWCCAQTNWILYNIMLDVRSSNCIFPFPKMQVNSQAHTILSPSSLET